MSGISDEDLIVLIVNNLPDLPRDTGERAMSWRKHWQPEDRKEDLANDIREAIQKIDPTAKLETLERMSRFDLTVLMLALRREDR
jgi:hypothetical protein